MAYPCNLTHQLGHCSQSSILMIKRGLGLVSGQDAFSHFCLTVKAVSVYGSVMHDTASRSRISGLVRLTSSLSFSLLFAAGVRWNQNAWHGRTGGCERVVDERCGVQGAVDGCG